MKARLGPAAATTATAHKIAVIFYTMIRKQVEWAIPLTEVTPIRVSLWDG